MLYDLDLRVTTITINIGSEVLIYLVRLLKNTAILETPRAIIFHNSVSFSLSDYLHAVPSKCIKLVSVRSSHLSFKMH